MGTSIPIFTKDITAHIKALHPKSVLDVGAGQGYYYDLIKSIDSNIICDAIEPTLDYVNNFNLKSKYRYVFGIEIQEFLKKNYGNYYDLCIMGDVLEHLFLSEAIDVIDALSYRCNHLMVIWPTNMPQHLENVYETHKSNFSLQDICRFNIEIYKKTFLYWGANTVPIEAHYALIAGHINPRDQNIRKSILDEQNMLIYGVENDV